MLVIVFNNGVAHKIKDCSEYKYPGGSFYGAFYSNGKEKGKFFDKSNVAFCYFSDEEDDEEMLKKALQRKQQEIESLDLALAENKENMKQLKEFNISGNVVDLTDREIRNSIKDELEGVNKKVIYSIIRELDQIKSELTNCKTIQEVKSVIEDRVKCLQELRDER